MPEMDKMFRGFLSYYTALLNRGIDANVAAQVAAQLVLASCVSDLTEAVKYPTPGFMDDHVREMQAFVEEITKLPGAVRRVAA